MGNNPFLLMGIFMDVYIKKKKRFEINSVDELEKYIRDNNIRLHFLKFMDSVRLEVDSDIKSTDKIKSSDLKGKFISKYLKCGTNMQIEYWLVRGYSVNNAQAKLSELQSQNSQKFHQKRKNNPDNYFGYNSTQLKYWLNKGYSVTDAHLKLSERQSTFSRDKLYKKYGKTKGDSILRERNEKWLKSLKENNN